MAGRSGRERRRRVVWLRWRSRLVGLVCWPTAAVLAVSLTAQVPALAARPVAPVTLSAQSVPSVQGTPVTPQPRPAQLTHGPASPAPVQVVWPAAGSAIVDVADPASAPPGLRRADAADRVSGRVRAGTLPVWVGTTPGGGSALRATVSVLDRQETPPGWRNGVLVRLSRADGVAAAGRATVSVDYSGFAGAFGGGYANRLRLVAMPECALSTPGAAGCQATPLPSSNDPSAKQVSADVTMAPAGGSMMVALTAGASGTSGTYAATSLSPSSSWEAGGNSGDFSWQYPIQVPPSLGGPVPTVELSYSSASLDGRNETTNNQPNWTGEGFDFWPGYIERTYKSCSDDKGNGANNTTDTGDMCWGTDNATMSLSGHSGELIKDDGGAGWRLKDDDNTKIEHLTGASNGDNDGEYWKVTTPDGTQYFFGLNRLTGYTGAAPADKTTSSVWTEPVAGNNPNEPCHQATFTGSFCAQAWRWSLDYVVDTHGNTMSTFYNKESNNYARNNTDTDVQSYVRGGTVDHIDYGTDNRSGVDTEETSTLAPMRVQFGVDNRCLSGCATHDVAHWPDTPWDQSCTSAASCPGLYTPTFWTTNRLATITTQVWDAGSASYKPVNQWTLTHTFPPSGDDTTNGMWLASIVHTGEATGPSVVGPAIAMPSVNFDWTQMANRVVVITDHNTPMNWLRLSTIWTDTGGKIDVRYTPAECAPGNLPASPQSNTLRCYPVLEQQADKSITTEYFHRYLVSSVTQADWTGGGKPVITSYSYVGSPGWRHADDDGMTKDNLRTWSDFRGYPQVNTQVGDPGGGQQTLTESKFFQGMNGDLDGSGGTRSVTLPAVDVNGDGNTTGVADAPAVPDENAYSGMTRQTTVYNGVETDPLSVSVSQPWQSAPTSTRNMGQTIVYARHTGAVTSWSGTKLSAGGWRVTRADTGYDSYGMPVTEEEQGDVAVTGDEKCTTTSYDRNTGANMLDLPGEIDVYALTCAKVANPGPASDADVISMTRTLYDHQAYGATPTKGESTETDVAKSWTAGSGPSWLTQATAGYDWYGRVNDVSDVRGNHTTTVFTPASGGPVTSVATTTPLGTSTNVMEPSWGSVTTSTDINNKRTDVTYDALGRTSQVWQPNHLKASFPTQPNKSYSYLVRSSGGVNAVTTNTLNAVNGYTSSIALYDGLLRPRQTQAVSLANGHVGTVFTDTVYDEVGRAVQQSQHFDATVQPSTTLFTIAPWQPLTQTVTQFDRTGRATAQIFNNQGNEQWRTTTTYGGDRVNVIPPDGGTATTTITDGLGRTTELRQYYNKADVGSDTRSLYDAVDYHYNAKGQEDFWTDNAGNKWTASFDLLGRQTAGHDPDKGDSSSTFNDQGDLLTTTDGKTQTLAYSYDTLGRKTGEYTPTTSGTKLATWAYDPTGAKGQLASSSRWVGTDEYKIKINGYTALYQPTGQTYTIPASQTGLAGTYSFGGSFNVDGSPATQTYAAAGGLGAETLTYTYDPTDGLPEQLQTNFPGIGQYVANSDYTAYGELSFVSFQTTGMGYLERSYTYQDDTHRLAETKTVRQTSPSPVDDTQYNYDAAGNVKKIIDTAASGAVDTQCFGYDYAQRLTDAWTPGSGDCTQAKSAAALGGPAPYWQSWTFDPVGNRKTQTTHTTAGDTIASSTYPNSGPNSVRPHAVTSVTTGSRTDNYTYDPSGNTIGRPGVTTAQTLSWDVEDHLSKDTENGQDTTYIYDANGNQLIQSDPTNTTLYLPGEDVVRSKATGVVSATRYYQWAGQTIGCITTGGGLTWLVADPQGTQQVTVDNGNQAISQRYQTPYGSPRGTNPTWPNTRGFVGGINDPTGLIYLGARAYDPKLGRFISVDPIFNSADPQSWTGYAYANNTPVTSSDPSGLNKEDWDPSPNDPLSRHENACDDACIAQMNALSNALNQPAPAPKPKPKPKHWWQKATHWVEQHKAQIAGFVVGTVVGLGCGALIGWTGVGAVACGALGGAVGALTQDLVEGGHSLGGIIKDTIVGGVVGGLLGGLGSVAGAALKAGAGALSDGLGAAGRAALGGARKELANIAEGRIGGALGKALGGGGEGAGAGGGCNSFTATTPVLMADGTTKAIKDVQVGDKVESTDPRTNTDSAQTVTLLHDNHDTDLTDVTVQTSTGQHVTIHTTTHHPFWNASTNQWTEAGQLTPGTLLHTNGGTDSTIVVSIKTWTGLQDMHNLTITNTHTYYVIAGTTPVLVHNTGPLCGLHGGDSGSPAGPGRVEGPAPAKAHDMLDMVQNRPGGIGKVPGYEGNASWGNKVGQLPGGAYREWDVNATADLPTCSVCGRPIRGPERLLTPKSGSGSVYYTPDHYGTFYYVGEY